jgi:superfamily II DNA or RNA helicase
MAELGQNFVDPGAQCAVAGVDTLLSRKSELAAWCQQVTLWVIDEAHHLLLNNKWGKAVALFPNARGLGVTATALRADGRGLGRHADGVMDVIVEGPTQRQLIKWGYLVDFKVFSPPCDLDVSQVPVTASGDFSKSKLKLQVRKSHIVGDVVEHYQKYAAGKLGVTFAPDVETATEIAKKYNEAGVPAEVVTAKTPGKIRTEIIRRFRCRELLQLVNVDLFGEGFDLPALEVVSFARPTESFAIFSQQLGRVLRIMEGKEAALVIDHVGNVSRHVLIGTDEETGELYMSLDRPWSLDRRERRAKKDKDLVATRICTTCTGEYIAIHRSCPYCGAQDTPADRSAPEFVDGDLTELLPEALAALRGEIAKVDRPDYMVRADMERAGAPGIAAGGAAKNHRLRQEAQVVLRESIAWWAGYQRAAGRPDWESYRRFYHAFGIDVLSAQALGRPAAEELTGRINQTIRR